MTRSVHPHTTLIPHYRNMMNYHAKQYKYYVRLLERCPNTDGFYFILNCAIYDQEEPYKSMHYHYDKGNYYADMLKTQNFLESMLLDPTIQQVFQRNP